MNLFDILSLDERVIVYSDVSERLIFTWNRSQTLQCWRQIKSITEGEGGWQEIDLWKEIDVRTLSDKPKGYKKARQAAIEWHGSIHY